MLGGSAAPRVLGLCLVALAQIVMQSSGLPITDADYAMHGDLSAPSPPLAQASTSLVNAFLALPLVQQRLMTSPVVLSKLGRLGTDFTVVSWDVQGKCPTEDSPSGRSLHVSGDVVVSFSDGTPLLRTVAASTLEVDGAARNDLLLQFNANAEDVQGPLLAPSAHGQAQGAHDPLSPHDQVLLQGFLKEHEDKIPNKESLHIDDGSVVQIGLAVLESKRMSMWDPCFEALSGPEDEMEEGFSDSKSKIPPALGGIGLSFMHSSTQMSGDNEGRRAAGGDSFESLSSVSSSSQFEISMESSLAS